MERLVQFLYIAWFECPYLPRDDQDFEWNACFVVDAASAEDAQSWGDYLSKRYAEAAEEPFLHSNVEPVPPPPDRTSPRIPWGDPKPSDFERLPKVKFGEFEPNPFGV